MKVKICALLLLSVGFVFAGTAGSKAYPELAGKSFSYQEAKGIGLEEGITRRDPSDIIKVGDTYYIYYTKVVHKDVAKEMQPLRASGYVGTVWYATSNDEGHTWNEKGQAVGLGKRGTFDSFATFTPNIVKFDGKYYLYYTGIKPTTSEKFFFENNSTTDYTGIGVAVADRPDGPFERISDEAVLKVTPRSKNKNRPSPFDSFRVDDAAFLVRDYDGDGDLDVWLYYKGRNIDGGRKGPGKTKMGLAIADGPESKHVRINGGKPILSNSHEVMIWPHREGVATYASMTKTIEYASDGIYFTTKPLKKRTEPKPVAPGCFRDDLTEPVEFGMGISWGIAMRNPSGPNPYLIRYELDLGVNAKQSKKPNIIFFLVDDMGWQDTSEEFHSERTALNDRYFTPNMERLADSGMKFTQAYACAVCSPTRISLMTGLNSMRHGVTNWTLRPNVSPDRNHPTLTPPKWNINGLSPVAGIERTIHAKTLPMYLQKAGYRTIHAGKAHFGADGMAGEMPEDLGFDVNIAGHCAGGPGSYYGKNNFSAAFRNGSRIWDVPGLEKYHGKDIYMNEALTIEALAAVDNAIDAKKPFYLYMSHYAIHAPYEADKRFLKKYKDAGLNKFNSTYASMIESMDKSLGDIMDHVKDKGIAENTIVIFMTDNGQPSGATLNAPLRGHKLNPYEGGIRVPLIVDWPETTTPGSVSEDHVIIEDIFPTVLEMAGVKEYSQIGGKIDGVSFVPLLQKKKPQNPNRQMFWHFPHYYDNQPYSMIRQGDWKLIYFHADGKYELYNITNDISEKNNLASSKPGVKRRLAKQMREFMIESGAQMPTYKKNGKAVPLPGG